MFRRVRALLSLGGLFALALVLAPTTAAGDPCYHGYTIPPVNTAETTTVKMDLCAFLPTRALVASGSTVEFVNVSSEAHLVTGANAGWGDRDKEIPAGGSVTVTFDQPGVYAYSCALHRGMTGAIIVGDGGLAASTAVAAGSASDGQGGLTAIAIAGLGGLACTGWIAAWLQRRRAPRFVQAPVAAIVER